MNTTQWKEKVTEWLESNKVKKITFLLIECKDCKTIHYSKVSLLLDMKKEKWACHSCRCKYWRLKTEDLGGWKRSGKCQISLLSVNKGTKFSE